MKTLRSGRALCDGSPWSFDSDRPHRASSDSKAQVSMKVSAPISVALCSPVGVSNFGDSSLHCDLSSFMDLRRVVF